MNCDICGKSIRDGQRCLQCEDCFDVFCSDECFDKHVAAFHESPGYIDGRVKDCDFVED